MSGVWKATILNNKGGRIVEKNGKKYLKTKMLWFLEDGMPPPRKIAYPIHSDFKVNKNGYRACWKNTPIGEWNGRSLFKKDSVMQRINYWGLRCHFLVYATFDYAIAFFVLLVAMLSGLQRISYLHKEHKTSKYQ
ncbi:hypothetical protein MHBO_001393 [Bonamia ostreae]|uniref:Uncharacterized protein n=1 Tax=Bonamia ostreae TaxID=126728 RepID=A0ABV2AJF1_9EUKA